jgi:hypothetical protein
LLKKERKSNILKLRKEITYMRELCVSSKLDSTGDTFTNMRVFALPPSESLINIVNL